jgi:Putative TM nitroreductase
LVKNQTQISFQPIFEKSLRITRPTTGRSFFPDILSNIRGSVFVQAEVGYTGEGIILEATALGLNTCWVSGFFNPESVALLVQIKSNERVLAVTPIGYAHRFETLEERAMTGFGGILSFAIWLFWIFLIIFLIVVTYRFIVRRS